jgi:hypothetical protein
MGKGGKEPSIIAVFIPKQEGSHEEKESYCLLGHFSFLTFTPSGIAKVYKYVDKNGIPHYTNVPTDPRYKPASGSTNKSPKKKSQKPVKKKIPDKIPQR